VEIILLKNLSTLNRPDYLCFAFWVSEDDAFAAPSPMNTAENCTV